MRRFCTPILCLTFVLGLANVSLAHFGMIMPDKSMVMQGDKPELEVTLAFCHPWDQKGLDLAKPKKFGVMAGKLDTDLTNTLLETSVLDKMAWKGVYIIKKPGIYTFYFDPEPYWEPAESKYIIHQTKTYVAALGYEEDWDQEVGLKAEIIPLTRPFAIYTGSAFRGILKYRGKPKSDADVEIECWNPGKLEAPNEYYGMLKTKTDENGIFSFAFPHAGWWGFSGICDQPLSMKHGGKWVNSEIAGVLWVYVADFPKAEKAPEKKAEGKEAKEKKAEGKK